MFLVGYDHPHRIRVPTGKYIFVHFWSFLAHIYKITKYVVFRVPLWPLQICVFQHLGAHVEHSKGGANFFFDQKTSKTQQNTCS